MSKRQIQITRMKISLTISNCVSAWEKVIDVTKKWSCKIRKYNVSFILILIPFILDNTITIIYYLREFWIINNFKTFKRHRSCCFSHQHYWAPCIMYKAYKNSFSVQKKQNETKKQQHSNKRKQWEENRNMYKRLKWLLSLLKPKHSGENVAFRW